MEKIISSRLLLITPVFYGVEKKIKSVLEESGYEVVWIENKTLTFDYHGANSKFRFLRRLYFLLFFPHERYIKKELKKVGNLRFDILFSINGNIICPYLFKKLKNKNPGLFSVLYLWDAFSMYNWAKEFKYFNKVSTFDSADAEKYQIKYQPNFFIRSSQNRNQEKEYDLFFAGKFNSFRFSAVEKILNHAKSSGLKYYIKLWPAYKILLHNYFIYYILKTTKINSNWVLDYILNYEAIEGLLKKEYIMFVSQRFEEIQNIFQNSNVILDLPFQGQTGYSHRLIDALANGKKVISTNSNIKKEVFFNSEQIHLLNGQNPEIDSKWIKEKFIFPVDKYFAELELSNWLKSVIDAETV
ncbi:MAG: hypothetical protein LLG13_01190 [Bacteroidales bacterium]|nr:hypothetical protein [Bacteroidales bacterium]